jgi:hypothetical protein
MTRAEIAKLLDLAASLFPAALTFPNAAEAAEWGRATAPYPFADVERAVREYFRDPDRRENRPNLGRVLARLRSTPRTTAHATADYASIAAARFGCDRIEAILRARRDDWARYAQDALERANKVAPGADAERAMILAQATGFRRRQLSATRYGLLAEGVEGNAAQAWAEVILAEPADFDAALDDLRERGLPIEQPLPTPTTTRPPLFDIFRPLPGAGTLRRPLRSHAEVAA